MTRQEIEKVDLYCAKQGVSKKAALRKFGFTEGQYYASRKKLNTGR